jgi:hypothetical protein
VNQFLDGDPADRINGAASWYLSAVRKTMAFEGEHPTFLSAAG